MLGRLQAWTRYLLHDVPMQIGGVQITPQVIADELAERTDVSLALAPTRLLDSTHSPPPVLLTCESKRRAHPHSNITLFGQPFAMCMLRNKVEVRQCTSCFSFAHKTADCSAPSPRCARCSIKSHETKTHTCIHCGLSDGCSHPAQCAVCSGPHQADATHCPLRPRFSKAAACLVSPDTANTAQIQMQQSRLYSIALAAAKKRTRAALVAAVKAQRTASQADTQPSSSVASKSPSEGCDAMDEDASENAGSVASGCITEAAKSPAGLAPTASEPHEASLADDACSEEVNLGSASAAASDSTGLATRALVVTPDEGFFPTLSPKLPAPIRRHEPLLESPSKKAAERRERAKLGAGKERAPAPQRSESPDELGINGPFTAAFLATQFGVTKRSQPFVFGARPIDRPIPPGRPNEVLHRKRPSSPNGALQEPRHKMHAQASLVTRKVTRTTCESDSNGEDMTSDDGRVGAKRDGGESVVPDQAFISVDARMTEPAVVTMSEPQSPSSDPPPDEAEESRLAKSALCVQADTALAQSPILPRTAKGSSDPSTSDGHSA